MIAHEHAHSQSPIEQSLCQLGLHDHLCLIYERNDDRLRAMVPFVQQGLENGERCVYVADGDTVDAVSGAMRRGGVNVDEAMRRGALAVARYKDIYLAPGAFDPDKVLDFAAGAGVQAVGEGYRGLRIAGEMTWVLHGDPGADRILEYETKVNSRIHSTPVTAICQYDRSRFTPDVIRDVIRTHPLVVIGDRVCRNFYYVPPGELRGPDMLDREVDRVLENILERERAEDALRESERRLSLVLEGSADAFWDWDLPSGRITHSARWGAMLGRAMAEQRGDLSGWRRVTHPDDWPMVERALHDHVEGRSGAISVEHRVRSGAEGAWRWVLARGKVVSRDAGGRPQRAAGTLSDVTERRSLQSRLETATRLASVGTLAAGVAHEINNPLSFVTNNLTYVAEQLAGAASDPATFPYKLADLRQAAREALDGAARVRDIVQALRGLAGPPREQKAVPVDVRAEIEAAVGIAKGQASARARLVVDLPEGLPHVVAGPHELGQVVLNLLVNAAHAIPEGRAEQNEIAVTAREDRGHVRIDVVDTGCGIPPAVLPRIFDPFFTTKEAGAGSGLGLAICHRIVQAAGGTIEVQSEVAKGTRFRIVLPAAAPAARAPEAEAAPRTRRKILVVDDEPFVGRAMARILAREHEVEAISSGEAANRRIVEGERWDVIFCDLLMPGMTGMDLAETLEKNAPDAAARLVFMTGGACTERARNFLERGAYPCLEKPVEPTALQEMVERVASK